MDPPKTIGTDYLTFLGHIESLQIPIYEMGKHLDCNFSIAESSFLGQGASMAVFKGNLMREEPQDQSKPISVAVKIPKAQLELKTPNNRVNIVLNDLRQELRIMQHLNEHPNIIRMYGVSFLEMKPILIVELGISALDTYLFTRKEDDDPVDWPVKAKFCCDIADGLRALHAVDVIHGDLKGENVLLFYASTEEEDESDMNLVAKISDFGYSATRASIERGTGLGGTRQFWAPECMLSADPDMKALANSSMRDNYSYGLLVWQVSMDGEIPYEDMEDAEIEILKSNDRDLQELLNRLPKEIPEQFRTLISRMTKYTPNDRAQLSSVWEIMMNGDESVSFNSVLKDAYLEAKKSFEKEAKEIPQGAGQAHFTSIEFMSIPLTLRTKVFRDYEKAARKGDAEAAFLLAACYGRGFGVERNEANMHEWCLTAADRGSLSAMISLCKLDLKDIPREPSVVFSWYLKAAETGDKSAQDKVGDCYHRGYGVEVNITSARYWWNLSNAIGRVSNGESLELGETSLSRAVRNGDTGIIRRLIQQENPDTETKNNLLHLAAECGLVDVARQLITEFKADPNAKERWGRTALHKAATSGSIELVKMLIDEFGADANAEDSNGETPLHLAAWFGDTEMVRVLVVNYGADANAENYDNDTPLHCAAGSGSVELVKMLVLEFGAQVNTKDDSESTLLHYAAANGRFEVVKALVADFGADPYAQDVDGRTPLHDAAGSGSVELVKLFVAKYGADVNARDKSGLTPLHRAAEIGSVEVVKVLIETYIADVNAKDATGKTALHYAATSGSIELVHTLINELGADVNAKDEYGRSPLHYAAKEKRVESIKALTGFGADVNLKDRDGKTPLHYAAEEGHVEIIKVLVEELGSDVNIMDNEDRTAMSTAELYGKEEVVDILKVVTIENDD